MMEEISWKQILGLENSHRRFIFIGNLCVDGIYFSRASL
jgi:hypothetical protein